MTANESPLTGVYGGLTNVASPLPASTAWVEAVMVPNWPAVMPPSSNLTVPLGVCAKPPVTAMVPPTRAVMRLVLVSVPPKGVMGRVRAATVSVPLLLARVASTFVPMLLLKLDVAPASVMDVAGAMVRMTMLAGFEIRSVEACWMAHKPPEKVLVAEA